MFLYIFTVWERSRSTCVGEWVGLQLLQINIRLFDWPALYERDTSLCSGLDLLSISCKTDLWMRWVRLKSKSNSLPITRWIEFVPHTFLLLLMRNVVRQKDEATTCTHWKNYRDLLFLPTITVLLWSATKKWLSKGNDLLEVGIESISAKRFACLVSAFLGQQWLHVVSTCALQAPVDNIKVMWLNSDVTLDLTNLTLIIHPNFSPASPQYSLHELRLC